MEGKKAVLVPDSTYHIYNRANGRERLFYNEGNYRYFLRLFEQRLGSLVDVYCYCLMPNHFHFLLRVKEARDIEEAIFRLKFNSRTLQGFQTLGGLEKREVVSKFLTQQFSHLFNAYAQALNKEQSRKGSLFMHPFKRKLVTDESYLRKLIHYIHLNPVVAGLVDNPDCWRYSSYGNIILHNYDRMMLEKVIGLFGDMENFKYCHS
ncbi:transposase [Snuella sedimenti]|uniref:transposase n=1 Tax=Snuella sedimenti TaxID=2798802 RepID=UPI001E3E3AC9|nr:transposase [Snuella sedimenti]